MKYEEAKETLVAAMKLKQYAADTQKKFVTSLTYICEYHSKYKCVDSLTVEDVESFLNHLAFEKSLSPSTVNNYHMGIKFLFQAVLQKEWPDEIEYFKVRKIRKTTTKTIPPTLKEKESHCHVEKINIKPIQNKALLKRKPTFKPLPISNTTGAFPLNEVIISTIKQMELRGAASGTQATYIRCISKFSAAIRKDNDLNQVALKDVQDFLHHRRYVEQLNSQTINVYRTALKFLYTVILDKEWIDAKVPSQKYVKRIPVILSKEEVINLLNAIESPIYKMISILMYSAGLRVSEAIKLRIWRTFGSLTTSFNTIKGFRPILHMM